MSAFDELMREAVGDQPGAFDSLMQEASVANSRGVLGTVADWYANQVDNTVGGVEAAASMASGIPAMVGGNVVGGAQMMTNPTAAPETAKQVTDAMTYSPQGARGQEILQRYGGMLSQAAETQIPYTDMKVGEVPAAAIEHGLQMPPPEDFLNQPVQGEAIVNEQGQYQVGGDIGNEFAARVSAAYPSMLEAGVTATGMNQMKPAPVPGKMPTDPRVKGILTGAKDAAKNKISPTGQIVPSPLGKKAISSGWGENLVGHASSLTKAEKGVWRRIVKKAETYYDEYASGVRPSDVVGDEFTKIVKLLKHRKSVSGKKLTAIAKDLGNKPVNTREFIGKLKDDIYQLGGTIDDQGKLSFGVESDLHLLSADQRMLIGLYDKSKTLVNANGYKAHRTKQWIDKYINYGKSINAQDAAITSEMQSQLRGYREMLNKSIRDISPEYAKHNDVFSTAAGPLADVQRAMGTTDILSDMGPQFLGQKFRAYLGNNQNRLKIEMAVGEAEAAARKLNSNLPKQNIGAQMTFINDMEKLWGPFTETAFKSEIGQEIARQAAFPSVTNAAVGAAQMTPKMLAKLRTSRAAQMKSLKNLLNQ